MRQKDQECLQGKEIASSFAATNGHSISFSILSGHPMQMQLIYFRFFLTTACFHFKTCKLQLKFKRREMLEKIGLQDKKGEQGNNNRFSTSDYFISCTQKPGVTFH